MFPVVRIVVKATIIFLHNIIVFFVVSIICEVQINLNQLFILPALLIYLINGLWAGLLLAIICARYRDMQPLITAVIGVLFLITPVLWFPGMLTDHRRFIALFNPLTHYIAIVMEPMLGISPDLMSWYLVLFLTVMGVLVTKLVYRVIRTKLILWL